MLLVIPSVDCWNPVQGHSGLGLDWGLLLEVYWDFPGRWVADVLDPLEGHCWGYPDLQADCWAVTGQVEATVL